MKSTLLFLAFLISGCLGNAQEAPINTSSPIQKAASTGDISSINKILAKDKKLLNAQDAEGMTPLMSAASNGETKAIKELLKKGADKDLKNKLGDTALSIAVTFEQFEAAKLLIKENANVDITVAGDDQNTLLIAAATLNPEITKLIIEKNKSVLNKTNKHGRTALMEAVVSNQNENAKLLLAKGANKLIKARDGKTAIDLAKEYYNEDAIKLLSSKK